MSRVGARLRGLVSVGGVEGPEVVAHAPAVPVREIFRRFWPYTRGQRRWLLVTALFIPLGPALETAELWLFKLVVDEVLEPRDLGLLLPLALAYVGLTLVGGVVSFCDAVLSTWVSQRFLLRLRTAFFRHVEGLSLDFFERRRLGDVVARLTGDVGAIESFLLSGVATAASYVVRLVFFAGALLYLNWRLALASFVVAPVFWAIARRFSGLVKAASREKRRHSGSISAVAEESLGNAALVQAYDRVNWEVHRFHREGERKFAAELASTRIKALYRPLVGVVELAGALSVIGLGTWELSRGRLSLGGLMVFLAFLSRLYGPIKGLTSLTTSVHAASAGAERILELLDQEPAVVDRPDARPLGRARGEVELDGVGFRYPGTEEDVLSDVSLRVGPGETLALVGPSGAGKSTLAKLLLRFYDPTAGGVRLDGHDLRDLSLSSLRANVAVVLQETLVFDGTVRENIAYGRPDATDEDVERAARAADAHDFVVALPDGYDTVVGQRGRRLSGGQRQRLAIARAMVRDAPVLLLDEPTTGLDAESGERVLGPLRRLMAGRTTIVISHNLLTVREATQIVVLERGRVVECGRHDELVAAGGSYARLYRLHAPEREQPAGTDDRPPRAALSPR